MFLSSAELFTYLLATFAVMATPGVTVSALTGTTLGSGLRAGFTMEMGAVLGRISMIAVLAAGLQGISQFMLVAFDWIKLVGAAYLIWIGIKAIRHPPGLTAAPTAPPGDVSQIVRGTFVLWGNPKALIFFGAFVPQFVKAEFDILPQVAFLGLIWVITAFCTDSFYILVAGRARVFFQGKSGRAIGWASGGILICAGLWLALQRKA